MDDDIKIFNAKPKNDTLDSIALIDFDKFYGRKSDVVRSKRRARSKYSDLLIAAEFWRSYQR